MLVGEIMQAAPATASVDTRLSELARLLARRGFRHVPIVEGDALIGIVSDRDLKQPTSAAAVTTDGWERGQTGVEPTAGQIMTVDPPRSGPPPASRRPRD